MFGISCYFRDLSYSYLEQAAACGAKYVFTSLHIPEEDLSQVSQIMPKFLQKIKEYGLELVPDISPVTFDKLNIPKGDFKALKTLGFNCLRLDYGFNNFDEIKSLQQDFKLILNASVIDKNYLDQAIVHGVDLAKMSVLHNFYPKKDTGLSMEFFKARNQVFKDYGIETMAFVAGDEQRRFPRYEGLPTIEKHRQYHPFVAAVELMQEGIDVVIIGDSKASIESLKKIQRYCRDLVISLPTNFDKQYHSYYNREILVRKDLSDRVIRLNTERMQKLDIQHNYSRLKGSIVIHNSLANRYCGEINICKHNLEADASCNLIGYIHPEYIPLLEHIPGNGKICFVKE